MRLSFHGAVRGVTGSCFLFETKSAKILVDCGLFQGRRVCGGKNYEKLGFDPKNIDAIIVTHAHMDHTGRIPRLIHHGFRGKIYMTPPTKSLTSILLDDAQRMMVENAEECDDEVLYGAEDVKKMQSQSESLNYHTEFEPVPGVKAMFHDAGHILGSAYVSLDIPESEIKTGKPMRFIVSGDIGNVNVPILPDTEPISSADVVLAEATYGDREHESVGRRQEKLAEMINRVIKRGGTLMIPAFSVERTQELLYELDHLLQKNKIPRVTYYLDSPLAIRTTDLYRKYKHYLRFDRPILSSEDVDFFSFPDLKVTMSVDESKKIKNDEGAKVIIAGSGMMTGGRILHHLKRYLDDEKNGVLIIGHQADGTLGRKIFDGESMVEIHRKTVNVRADVEAIGAFSAHGDRIKMARWLTPQDGKIPQVFLVHGDEEVKPKFKEYLESGIGAEVIIPEFHQEFEY